MTGVAAASSAGYLLLLGVRTALTLRHTREMESYPPADEGVLMGLTVLRPILGGDADLAATLTDALAELPEARFVWCVDEDDPVGRAVADQVAAAHPRHRVEIAVSPPAPDGVNPKSFKLGRATVAHGGVTAGSTHDPLLVLDDDTRVSRRGVLDLLAALERHDLATGLPTYRRGTSVPGRLVEQFVNSSAALTYLGLAALGEPRSVNGMTYLLTRGTLARMGGFAAVERVLVDDLAVAERLHAVGGTIAQLASVQRVSTTVTGLSGYVALMHRWMLFARLLVERESPVGKAVVVGLLGTPPPLLGVLIGQALLRRRTGPLALAVTTLAVRQLTLATLNRRLGAGPVDPFLSPLAELLVPVHMLHALLDRTVTWRSRRYVVHAADSFAPARAGVHRA